MNETLYPVVTPEVFSPRGWRTVLCIVFIIVAVWIFAPRSKEDEVIIEDRDPLEERKKNWKKLQQQSEVLSQEEFINRLYALYAQGLDEVYDFSIQSKSLKQLTSSATITQKEKTLFGVLYTPLFSQEGRPEKKREIMLNDVYQLILDRYEAVLATTSTQ